MIIFLLKLLGVYCVTVYWFILANIAKQNNVYKPKSGYFTSKNNRNTVRTALFRKNNKAPKHIKLWYVLLTNSYFTDYKCFLWINTVLIKAVMVLLMTITYCFTALYVIKTPCPMFSETSEIGFKLSFLSILLFWSYFFIDYTTDSLYYKLSSKFKNNKVNLFLASLFPFYGVNIYYIILNVLDEKFNKSYKLKGKLSFLVFNIILITILVSSYSIIFKNVIGFIMPISLLFIYLIESLD
jgi:hypothetical protein